MSRSTCRRISAIKGFQLRHELALYGVVNGPNRRVSNRYRLRDEACRWLLAPGGSSPKTGCSGPPHKSEFSIGALAPRTFALGHLRNFAPEPLHRHRAAFPRSRVNHFVMQQVGFSRCESKGKRRRSEILAARVNPASGQPSATPGRTFKPRYLCPIFRI